ncbi:multidrug effflux MFS transporter [Leeia sp. TBRC 13508]|uniref:Bcr/CflA family efflux transporter n=1 Tax=Leeia speluncae TaxID=2884804 RepID=A0ABS8DAJ2_9NEIS|nr:multidrug effflux MFS transporter [Leeia speluncae]MCB6185229.1 multidrug effflux MFS transporter [Leeia speluncae]
MRHSRNWSLAAILACLAMLGPFSIDAYLPAFNEIAQELNATQLQVQQTLTAYMLAFSAMMLWHGSISDAIGRRPVILVSLFTFAIATFGCAASYRIEYLLFFRVLQGLSAGAGITVGRAMIRDRFDGHEAQQIMSRVTMIFSLAPGIAPVIGGALQQWFGWHAIFLFVAGLTSILLYVCYRWLPETLLVNKRQSLSPRALAVGYKEMALNPTFLMVALTVALNFGGLFLYISSAPVLLTTHLGLKGAEFGYLFVPAVFGIFLGGWLSGKMAATHSTSYTVCLAFCIMGFASIFNVGYHSFFPPSLPWTILPVMIYTCGMSLSSASITIVALDLFPQRRGMVASLQSAIQVGLAGVVSGVVSPILSHSVIWLAGGMFGLVVLGLVSWGLSGKWKSPVAQ